MAVDIDLDGGVDGDDPQAADHLGRVGDLHRAEDDLVPVAIEFVEKALPSLVRQGHRRAGGDPYRPHVDQVEDRILQHLGVDIEVMVEIVLEKAAQDGVGDIADPRLPGQ